MPNIVGLGPERKNVDTIQSFTVALAGTFSIGTMCNLIPVALGGSAGRQGRKIQMDQVLLRYECSMGAATTNGGTFRIKMVYDKQANGSTITATDVFSVNSALSHNNLSAGDRFITLMDILTTPISSQGNTIASGFEKRSINLAQIWSDNLGGVSPADSLTGSIWLLVANSGTFLTSPPDFNAIVRIRYTDN